MMLSMGLNVICTGVSFGLLLQEGQEFGATQWTLWAMLQRMGTVGIIVIIILALMSMYSIAIMIERLLTYSAAKKQSREYAPKVASVLRDRRIEEAITLSGKYKKSHLAMVVNAGLQEFRSHQLSTDIPGEIVEATRRSLQRAVAIKTAEFKRGLSALATIGSTAPFVGLFGTVIGIVNAFQGLKQAESAGIGAVAGGISEALVNTAFGLFVAIPAVWMFNYFTNRVDSFIVEMENSSSELVDVALMPFLKQRS